MPRPPKAPQTLRSALARALGLLLCLTATPALAGLQDGQVINLKCLAGTGDHVWLHGDPATGAVTLTATTQDAGTVWQAVAVSGTTTSFNLKCLGTGGKPWLDGNTTQASVQLTDTNSGVATTVWQVQDNTDGTISLACTGGPFLFPWLFGDPSLGMGLRESTAYPGTHWQVQNASTSAPGCFDLTSPADGSTVANPPTLAWQASTGVATYGLRIYDTSCLNGSAIYSVDNLTATSAVVPAGTLQNGKTYAWLVAALNSAGTIYSNDCSANAGGACWTFTAAVPAPGCFDLASPPSGSSVTVTPTLKWHAATDAITYELYIYDTSCANGDALYAVSNLTSTSYTVPPGVLLSGKAYAWLVSAVNGSGTTHSNTCSTSYNGACWTFDAGASPITEYPVPTASSRPEFVASGSDGALWFTEVDAGKIGRITTAGLVTEFPIPTANGWPFGITTGPDADVWFTEVNAGKVASITPGGLVTEFPIPTTDSSPSGIAAGPDGSLWFTEYTGDKIGKITAAGVITEFPVPTAGSGPFGITSGPDGNLWFAEANGNRIGRITTAGVVTEFRIPTAGTYPRQITSGSDGNLWFTEYSGNSIGRITPAGVITEFAVPSASSWPFGIASGSDGNLWFTEYTGNRLGSITTAGVVTEFTIPTGESDPVGVTSGPDGKVWFTERNGNKIGQFALGAPLRSVTVPIVLSAPGLNGSFFTSELALTNKGASDLPVRYRYTPAFGGSTGSGTDTLAPGTQKIVPDAIEYLKSLGIPVGDSGGRGGTLRIDFSGAAGAATVRTTTAVPGGRAGLAYQGLPPARLLSDSVTLCGLRQNATDRSNVAVLNAGSDSDGSITLRLTVISGDPAQSQTQALPDVSLAPGAFSQVSGVLASNGLSLTNGVVQVDRISGTAPFYAYGVINDSSNSDGSFVAPVPAGAASPISRLTLPVLLETGAFSTELVVTNLGSAERTLHATWVASALTGGQVSFPLSLLPNEQRILPAFVQMLRSGGVVTDPAGPSFVGALFVEDATGDLRGVAVAARITTPGGGGRYGTYFPAVPAGTEAAATAWLYDLRQDAENRTNLALVNVGSADSSTDEFRVQIYDGATGRLAATADGVSVPAKGFLQIDAILSRYAPSTSSGYAVVKRTSGSNPFIAYAVVNDGGQPGERSGDGATIEADVSQGP